MLLCLVGVFVFVGFCFQEKFDFFLHSFQWLTDNVSHWYGNAGKKKFCDSAFAVFVAGAAFSDSILAVFVAGATFSDSVVAAFVAGAAFSDSVLAAQHLVTLEWKELSRACGEMLNRNVEINVALVFCAGFRRKRKS